MKNMKIKILLIIALCSVQLITAQVGIGTTSPDPSAVLEMKSSVKGFLPPRMDTDHRDDIAPVAGLTLYNTDDKCINFYNGTVWVNPCAVKDSNIIVTPPTFPEGSLNVSTRTCFDIALSNDFVNGGGSLALRALRQADFTTTDTNTQTITISTSIAITDLLIQVVDVDGNIVSSITQPAVTALDPSGTASTTATIEYKPTLNTDALGLTTSSALSAGIYVTYKEGGVDMQNAVIVKIKDVNCGSQTSPGVVLTNYVTSDGKVFNIGQPDPYTGRPTGDNMLFNEVPLPALAGGGAPKIVSVTSGSFHSVALSEEGKIYGWGLNSSGELGNTGVIAVAQELTNGLPASYKIAQVSATLTGTSILTENNEMYVGGYGWALGISQATTTLSGFVKVDLNAAVITAQNGGVAPVPVQIYASGFKGFFIDDQGALWSTGTNTNGSLGKGSAGDVFNYVKAVGIPVNVKVLQVVSTEYNSAVILDNGKVFVAGLATAGIHSTSTTSGDINSFEELLLDGEAAGNIGTIVAIYLGNDANGASNLFLLDSNNKVYAKGYNFESSLGINDIVSGNQLTFKDLDLTNLNGERILTIKPFQTSTSIITESGKIYTAGSNNNFNILTEPGVNTDNNLIFSAAQKPNALINSFIN